MSDLPLTARWQQAVAMVFEAGAVTLEYFGRDNFQVESKADDSPVTVADRQAEQLLRRRIREHFPHDAILGEEFGEEPGSSGYRWILDPIDGTKSFIHGVPLYGTLIGVEFQGASRIGVIHIPVLNETVHACQGAGAWFRRGTAAERPAQVGNLARLDRALFCTSEVDGFRIVDRWEVLERLQAETRLTRTWGDCYGYLLVATGRCDLMVDPRMHLWDAAALAPVLEEAGGLFTDWEGVPRIDGGNGIATNRLLLPQVVALTRSGEK